MKIRNIELSGEIKKSNIRSRGRFRFCLICLFLGFSLILLKITHLSILYNKNANPSVVHSNQAKNIIDHKRADIVDRNGELLATSLLSYDLSANPKLIKNEDKSTLAKSISMIFSDVSEKEIYKKLNINRSFVYLKRSITPKEFNAIVKLKEPEIFRLKRYKRHYPNQKLASHILGGVDIDNQGIRGIEKTFDKILKNKDFINQNKELQLSIDIRIQKILDDNLNETINKHHAQGGVGIILDIKKSEILAMNSLPQFNPNKIHKISHKNEFNMATLGVYELGSIFKSLTIAMALDKNIVNEDTIYDATKPLKKGKYTIHDYKPQKRSLKISECILYSSNICFAQVGKDLGEKNIKEYLKKMKLSNKAEIEVPEIGNPLLPNIWRETNIMTFAYGHGIAISPLQFVNAFTSIINGGNFRYATLIKEKYLNDTTNNNHVISKQTSYRVRQLLREVVSNEKGSGDKADVPGYFVAGKTGTAIKNEYNRYEKNKNLTSFVGFFPSYNPDFLIFIAVDEPQPIKETFNYVTGGWVAAPTVRKIISEMAPKLGIMPKEKIEKNIEKHVSLKRN